MALPRYRANNTPSPSGSAGTSGSAVSPAPAPASSGGTPTTSKSSKNSGNSGILLGISGGWLVARMFLFGGALWLLEIIAIVITAGVAHSKGGKGQKVTAKIIIGLAVLNLFIPGFNSWVKGIRDNQLNTNTEQSSQQQEQAAPAPVEEELDKRAILPRTNNPRYLTKSGQYEVKPGKYRLCLSWLGYDTGYVNQWIKVNEVEYKASGSECHLLPIHDNIIKVEFLNPPQNEFDTYLLTRNKNQGQGIYPFLESME
jgi:hypothetical protein